MSQPPLILASTSRYRRELLERLRLRFHVARPELDETALPGEAASALVLRLARGKAEAIAANHPNSWIIGSDQAVELDDGPRLDGQPLNSHILGKPGTREAAIAQLRRMSGHAVNFRTGVCLLRGDTCLTALDTTTVHFRALDDEDIERYVDAEQPLDCAGSFKSEGLGISLFESIDNRDPTALVGLPMIALSQMLRQAGFQLP